MELHVPHNEGYVACSSSTLLVLFNTTGRRHCITQTHLPVLVVPAFSLKLSQAILTPIHPLLSSGSRTRFTYSRRCAAAKYRRIWSGCGGQHLAGFELRRLDHHLVSGRATVLFLHVLAELDRQQERFRAFRAAVLLRIVPMVAQLVNARRTGRVEVVSAEVALVDARASVNRVDVILEVALGRQVDPAEHALELLLAAGANLDPSGRVD